MYIVTLTTQLLHLPEESGINQGLFFFSSDLPAKLLVVLPPLVSHLVAVFLIMPWSSACLQGDSVRFWTLHRGRVLQVFDASSDLRGLCCVFLGPLCYTPSRVIVLATSIMELLASS